jgi:hypothetical protein
MVHRVALHTLQFRPSRPISARKCPSILPPHRLGQYTLPSHRHPSCLENLGPSEANVCRCHWKPRTSPQPSRPRTASNVSNFPRFPSFPPAPATVAVPFAVIGFSCDSPMRVLVSSSIWLFGSPVARIPDLGMKLGLADNPSLFRAQERTV